MYNQSKEFSELSMQHWLSNEVFTFGWFMMLGILIIFYVVWFTLLDKKRTVQLLLIGSLSAVFSQLNIMFLTEITGAIEYRIRFTPFHSSPFISSVTLTPIILMLVQQYTISWKGYILWSGIGLALECFVIFPVYMFVGILELHNWNVFFHFLVLFVISLFTRFIFLWIVGAQKRHSPTSENTP